MLEALQDVTDTRENRPVPTTSTSHGVTAYLHDMELWQSFHDAGTEMIITKAGRRMFPSLRVSLQGLEPTTLYSVLLDWEVSAEGRMKYSGDTWTCAGPVEDVTSTSARRYVHPDSPATGSHWMSEPISMQRAKMTNNAAQMAGNVVLTSMHRYQPRVHVLKAQGLTATFVFPVTSFIAVTAYQNERITQLKIDNNPFAKGFREKTRRRIKCEPAIKEEVDEHPVKRPCSETSWSDDSGRSSLGSTPPAVGDLRMVGDVSEELRWPFPLPLPWEHFAMGLAVARSLFGYSAYGVADLYHTQQLWRYPHLMPIPPLSMFAPIPYSLPVSGSVHPDNAENTNDRI